MNMLQRLEKLERERAPKKLAPLTVLRFIIPVEAGKAGPWNPKWAHGGGRGLGTGETIKRNEGESPEAFEARAKAHFPPAGTIYFGCTEGPQCEASAAT